ncbi:DUF4142 domain-containing protein [Mucilaginibacter pallidiroseus]|nr:DUF4142 domain-containing protein [Mucilaginibacter pallidiroseus]
MKTVVYILIAATMLSSFTACNRSRKSKNYNNVAAADSTSAFLKSAVAFGNAEVKYGSIALQNSKNSSVRALAKMIIADQTDLLSNLHKLASKKGVNVNGTTSENEAYHLKSLSAKTASAFDKEYVQLAVTDHERAVKLFNTAQNDPDAEVSDFAAKYITQLQEHLKNANAICQSEGLK